MFQDFRFALRQLAKAPGFAAIAILTLALGIGANTAIFSVTEALLLSPLPFAESNRLAQIWHSPVPGARAGADGGTFLDWKKNSSSFEAIAAIHQTSYNISGIDEPAQLNGLSVSADYLRILRVAPTLGRDFTAADDAAGGDNNVVILSHELWKRKFSGDPSILGKTVHLDGRSFSVIGVLPPAALQGIAGANLDFLVPAAIEAAEWKQRRNYNYVCLVIGRLKPGLSFAQAQAELVAANNALQSLYPPNKSGWTVTVESVQDANTSGARPYILMLTATVGVVLLIACANVANLMLARASSRQSEIAVRVAMGASVGRIIRLLLVESTLIALLGGAAGLLVASFAIGPMVAFSAANLLPGLNIGINLNVLLFTLGLSLVTGILFGLFPALRIARPNLVNDLKESSRGAVGGSRQRLQRTLIVLETGLTVVLLFTSGLLLRSFMATLDADTGLRRDNILMFDINRDSASSPSPAHRVRFIEDALRELSSRPGIISAGMISSAPFNNQRFYGDTIRLSENPDPHADIRIGFDGIAGDLFQTLGVSLLRGRYLSSADSLPEARKALLVNRALAQQLFGEVDPVGRHVHFKNLDWEVVGVVGNMSRVQLDAPPPPMVYLPAADFPWTITLAIRTHGSPMAAADAVRSAIKAIDPNQPIADLRTMQQAIDGSFSLQIRRVMLTLVSLFAGIALLLACVGLYGVMSYSVSQRTRELGVRIALGAETRQLLLEVVRGGLYLVAVGVAIGAGGSVLASFGIDSQIYGLQMADQGLVFAAVAITLLLVAVLACLVPARRATRVDPVVALRAD